MRLEIKTLFLTMWVHMTLHQFELFIGEVFPPFAEKNHGAAKTKQCVQYRTRGIQRVQQDRLLRPCFTGRSMQTIREAQRHTAEQLTPARHKCEVMLHIAKNSGCGTGPSSSVRCGANKTYCRFRQRVPTLTRVASL